ncbi:GNAT family N-acetyltransferase [Streptomyces candidus]|uniref:Ribosomal-protein-alanine N-acetyltransferase n=1 Tax=Streptomyces candidus TaxID=67283 RepID=A0A7X0HFT4_9ACTN|nr:GNAT family N-acetyltransferase [Streptomyces candidus]MBB6436862.1 ribosomal-protein-alanine N-acetyltransferase [Streptomyces candidus]GHH32052.1 ribosomal-protein-alanine N-acetyltransferase [Streptomyces candidus]
MIPAGIEMRTPTAADVPALAAAFRRNRDHLRPWEPRRPESFFTEEGQARRLGSLLADRDAGRAVPWVLVDAERGLLVGAFTLTNVVLGPFRSANLGYWVDGSCTGRGLATAAVRRVCDAAREETGLHRIEAATLLTNAASQRVLEKSGFEEIGVAGRYLHIDGEWRDHRVFQRVLFEGEGLVGGAGE